MWKLTLGYGSSYLGSVCVGEWRRVYISVGWVPEIGWLSSMFSFQFEI